MKRINLILFLLCIFPTVLLLPLGAAADDEKVLFSKSLTAKEYDHSLPSVPIEKWLRSVLNRNTVIEWSPHITDCGEQTGNPDIDKGLDIQLCAEVELKEDNKVVGYLLLFIGTEKEGLSKEKAGLYYGYINLHGKEITIKKLSDLLTNR